MARMIEILLFIVCVRLNIISDKFKSKWINRLATTKGFHNGTLYISSSLWGAKIKHPELKLAFTVEQVIFALRKDRHADVVYLGEYNDITKQQINVLGMKQVHEVS